MKINYKILYIEEIFKLSQRTFLLWVELLDNRSRNHFTSDEACETKREPLAFCSNKDMNYLAYLPFISVP
eukprot:snap_masked-scaffold_4-processed-gene-3.28-mRNA-1 protein AED:1.00 eAED:1.00 QI:0/0/0/0/1/1/2/0/69